MTVNEKMREALDLTKLDVAPRLNVVGVEAEDYVDSSGEEAIQVYVILSDDTDEYNFSGTDIIQLKSSIRNNLLSHGITLFPYVDLIKESEWKLDKSGE